MSEGVEEPVTKEAPRKRLSGLLLASLFLMMIGYTVLPVFPAALALLIAWLGKNRVRKDPNIIGPRFATWCMVGAFVSLPLQGFMP